MRKKDISRILRQARDLMNQGGKHWVTGILRTRGKEPSFCSIGAVNVVTGRANGKYAYRMDNRNRAAMYALANEIRRTERLALFDEITPANDAEVMQEVWEFNDEADHTWDDIQGVFTRAAKNPVIPNS